MVKRGRPKSNPLSRAEQLRRAKHAQRARERAAGTQTIQLALPVELARKLGVARHAPDFLDSFNAALDRLVVRVTDYPLLADLAWSRSDELIPAQEAFALYERNWRFVEGVVLEPDEQRLLERLIAEYGHGVVNA